MNITFFGTYNAAVHPRVQVLIDGLRVHGVTVDECNVPLNLSTSDRVAILQKPWKLPWLLVSIAVCWLKLIGQRRRVPKPEAVVVGYLGQFDIHLAKLLFRKQPLILDYMISGSDTARDRQVNGGLKHRLLRWIDNSALAAAQIVLVDSDEHLQNLPAKYRHKGLVVHVGAPQNWFDAALKVNLASGKHITRAVFFGSFTPLQGAPVIGQALAHLKSPTEVTMIGNGQDLEVTKQFAGNPPQNVQVKWLDWVEAGQLPGLVATFDVCLGIFGQSDKSQRVVPNKLFQGAAVGCALITSDTAPQRRVLGNAAIYVPAGDPSALAKALDDLGGQPAELSKLRLAARQQAQKHFAPPKIIEPLLEKLNFPI